MGIKPLPEVICIEANIYRKKVTDGYSYTVIFNRNKKTHRKTFSFYDYPSLRACLKAARAYRDAYDKAHPRKDVSGLAQNRPSLRNTTGVAGISHDLLRDKYPLFRVTWREDGKRKSKAFFYQLHDDEDQERAFKLAKKCRRKVMKEVYKGKTL